MHSFVCCNGYKPNNVHSVSHWTDGARQRQELFNICQNGQYLGYNLLKLFCLYIAHDGFYVRSASFHLPVTIQ